MDVKGPSTTNTGHRAARIIVILSLVLFLTAACSKVTKENYDRIRTGMEYSEVVKILGEPRECSGVLGAKDCIWGDEEQYINVKLMGDKVVFFSSRGL